MPLKSKKQAAFMYAKHPDIAKKWQEEAPVDIKKLPKKVKSSKYDSISKAMKKDKK